MLLQTDATLLRTVEALSGTLQMWRSKRAARVQAYESLMVRNPVAVTHGYTFHSTVRLPSRAKTRTNTLL